MVTASASALQDLAHDRVQALVVLQAHERIEHDLEKHGERVETTAQSTKIHFLSL